MARGKKAAKALTPEERLEQALVPVEEQPYPIPENWCWVTIGAIASVKGGKRIPKGNKLVEYKTDHPYIRVTDFDNRSIATEQVKYIDEETFKLIRNYTISTQDVYISIAGTIGKVGIIPDDLDGANLTENAAKITNIRGVEKNFLLWLLESEVAQSQMRDATISTTQPKLALFRIENVKFPLSPLTEQQRIVSRIESLFSKLDEAKEKAQAVVDGFELRKSAILHKAFTGELTEKWRKEHGVGLDSWAEQKLKDTTIQIIDGDRGTSYPKKQDFTSNGYCIFLNAKNVTKVGFKFEQLEFISKEKDEELRSGKLTRGDIVLTTRGTIGNVAIYDSNVSYEHLRINSGMVIFRNGIEFYKSYIVWLFQSRDISSQIEKLQTGSAQPQLPIKVIKELLLPVPSVAEQVEIVRLLDFFIYKEQQAKAAAESVLSQIDTMKKAILARAFRGELGTNDPAEEWAGELVIKMI